jgi:hypothetical protein
LTVEMLCRKLPSVSHLLLLGPVLFSSSVLLLRFGFWVGYLLWASSPQFWLVFCSVLNFTLGFGSPRLLWVLPLQFTFVLEYMCSCLYWLLFIWL